MNNRFSIKNKLLYKMKCLNTRNEEYIKYDKTSYDKETRYEDIIKR